MRRVWYFWGEGDGFRFGWRGPAGNSEGFRDSWWRTYFNDKEVIEWLQKNVPIEPDDHYSI